MEFKNGDRVIDKKTGKKGMFTEYDWACKDLAWILYDGEKEERKAWNHDLEIAKEKENVFSWIDYEQNSALFIEGIGTNVAILRHKDFRLTDNTTGRNIKINAPSLDEAKVEAVTLLRDSYWKGVYKDLGKILELIK